MGTQRMWGETMPYTYCMTGMAKFFDEFINRLNSELSLRGVEIKRFERVKDRYEIDVEHEGEKGTIYAIVDKDDIKVAYVIEREKKEVKEGITGAITGGALATFLSGILRGDRETLGDAVAWALAGGALGAYHGHEASMQEATHFSILLSEAMRTLEEEFKRREEERIMEIESQLTDIKRGIEEIEAELLVLKEDLRILTEEGKNTKSVEARIRIVERLLKETKEALSKRDISTARTKSLAARRMLEIARRSYEDLLIS